MSDYAAPLSSVKGTWCKEVESKVPEVTGSPDSEHVVDCWPLDSLGGEV